MNTTVRRGNKDIALQVKVRQLCVCALNSLTCVSFVPNKRNSKFKDLRNLFACSCFFSVAAFFVPICINGGSFQQEQALGAVRMGKQAARQVPRLFHPEPERRNGKGEKKILNTKLDLGTKNLSLRVGRFFSFHTMPGHSRACCRAMKRRGSIVCVTRLFC